MAILTYARCRNLRERSKSSIEMSIESKQRIKATWSSLSTAGTPEERAAELVRVERLLVRDMRRAFVLTLVACVFWVAIGLAFVAWAVHTTNVANGLIAFWSGLVAGCSGSAITLARCYLKGEREGWW